jgi:CRISPR/Cas system-associated exonuclease Cas4 (RecB family)
MKKSELVIGKVYLVRSWRGDENLVCVSIPEDTKNRTAVLAPVNEYGQPSKYTYACNLSQIKYEVADTCQEYILDKQIKDAKRVLDEARRKKINTEFKQVRKELGLDSWRDLTPKDYHRPTAGLKVELSLDEWEVLVNTLKKAVK